MDKIRKYLPHIIALFGSIVFLDSLRFKFTNAPESQVIFGKLNDWATSFGADGLFSPWGLFGQYAIGSAELIAAIMLLIGISSTFRRFQVLGAYIAFLIMTGAVSFHLFTPLGIDPNNDGGGLFVAAVVLWFGTIALLYFRRDDLKAAYRAKINYLFPNQ